MLADVTDQLFVAGAREIGSSDTAGKKGVSDQDRAGLRAVEALPTGRMPRGVQDFPDRPVQFDLVTDVENARHLLADQDRHSERGAEIQVGIIEHGLIQRPDAQLGVGIPFGDVVDAGDVVGVAVGNEDGFGLESVLLDEGGDALVLRGEAGIDDPTGPAVAGVDQVGVLLKAHLHDGL